MGICKECYSEENRITPLLNPQDCLENHEQYICGTCGRCICIDKDEKRNVQRWNFPFKSLEIALLYLRTADYTMKKPCGIYEIINTKGRKSYKIFARIEDLKTYLDKNKDKSCEFMKPIYIREEFLNFPNTQVKFLNKEEIELYLIEQKNGI
ncbi:MULTISPECIES: hypothetical protein [Clostridia]|uniref:hypothetical protein n=1 Tax=Clostridium cochlearium TaxID=1494 RepID=UPI0019247C1D|nr:hypothetical protein [Clostridium cochlearium]